MENITLECIQHTIFYFSTIVVYREVLHTSQRPHFHNSNSPQQQQPGVRLVIEGGIQCHSPCVILTIKNISHHTL